MLRNDKKTVFIIGAGASCDVGLPIGAKLTEKISKKLKIHLIEGVRRPSDQLLHKALNINNNSNKIYELANKISGAMPLANSIDEYLESHKDNEDLKFISKCAIVRSILHAETESLLYVGEGNFQSILEKEAVKNSWYAKFWKLLTQGGCSKEDVAKRLKDILFISFNYDRCFEHFIFNALKQYYFLNDTQAIELLSGLDIVHPYGQIGKLPFQSSENSISFGYNIASSQIRDLALQIKTFSERLEEEEMLKNMRKVVSSADTIIFLGFGYHSQNMRLLKTQCYGSAAKRIYATCMGISPHNQGIVQEEIEGLFNAKCVRGNSVIRKIAPQVYMHNHDCSSLFDAYWYDLIDRAI